MNPFTAYRLHITPLSPVHIGTGESYQPTNYVIEDGALHEFDTGAAMAALTAKDREDLLKIASGKPDADMLKALQGFFYNRRQPLQAHAVNCIPVLDGIAELYDKRVGKTAQHEGGGKQVINRLEIDRAAYNPVTRLPVLFGSSLKGAIRTALLDWKNQGQPLRNRQERSSDLQQRLFNFRAGKFELDPLRLVQLADAYWQGEAGLPAALVQLAVNRKKHPVKDTNGQLRKAMGENLYQIQILECVPGWHYRGFASQLNVQCLNGIAEANQRDERRLPAADLRFGIAHIVQACNRFFLPILTNERKILREQGFLDTAWSQAVNQTLALAQDKIKQGQAFLLRVGRHSGAESVTLAGEGVRNIKIMKGKGQPPDYADAAKTLWLAADDKDQRQNLLPFGWLLVEVEPFDAPTPDWPELRELCEPHLKTARAFAKQRESQREALQQARAEAEAHRRVEAEQARIEAEQKAEAARLEAERQAKLAGMSEQGRQVEIFRQRMEREAKQWAGTGNGGAWLSDLKKLVEGAAGWAQDDQEALVACLRALGQHDPRLAPKKNEGIKKLIKSLSA